MKKLDSGFTDKQFQRRKLAFSSGADDVYIDAVLYIDWKRQFVSINNSTLRRVHASLPRSA